MVSKKDHYEVLGVEHSATHEKIRKAFRHRAKDCHPDCAGPGREAQFRELAEAHEVLTDPALRRSHDAELAAAEGARSRAEPGWPAPRGFWGPPPTSSPLRDASPIRDVTPGAPRYQGRGATPRPQTELSLVLTPSEADHGGRLPLGLSIARPCPSCSRTPLSLHLFCSDCLGTGQRLERLTFELDLPPGLRDGQRLEARLGRPGEPGALRIRLKISLDPWA